MSTAYDLEKTTPPAEPEQGEYTCCVTVTGSAPNAEDFEQSIHDLLGTFADYTVKIISGPELNAI